MLIDPVLLRLGPIEIRWYSLAYIFGIIFAWLMAKYLNKKDKVFDAKAISDDFFFYCVLSVIVGGRLGYVLFYNPLWYFAHPLDIFKIWQGGMSFHGGFVGVVVFIYWICKKHKIDFWRFSDLLAVGTPIGLFFGRIANFINMELYGRVTESRFGMVFPNAGNLPRHPSQLYEAFFEGFVLFVVLFCLANFTNIRKCKGVLTSLFLIGYGVSRFVIEFFREPDQQMGYILGFFTMGQLLSLPIIIFGACILIFSVLKSRADHRQ